jgi:CubicO group peptidase (beta-lactamase class C family)
VHLRRLLRRLAFLVVTVLLLVPAGSTAPPRAELVGRGDLAAFERYFEWYIPRQLRRHGVPGVSVALVDEHGIVWARGFGHADLERRVRATTQTVYQVGSLSKVVTATAVMREVERGRLRLDAPIQKYLPKFSIQSRWGSDPAPTLRELLSHHAGLPTYYLKGFFSRQPLAELVEALKAEHLAYPPRTVFNYSNLGPDIAGAALERLSHQDFAAYMQQALLDPLGMAHSSFAFDARVQPLLARGYVKQTPAEPVTIRDAPAGGLFSNAEDLARFMRLVLRGGELDGRRLLRPETVAAMLTPQYADAPLNFGQRFGLGWMLSGIPVENAGSVAWHNGGTKTFLSQMVLLPEKKLGVVVLANADTAGPVVYETAEEILRLALQVRAGITPPPTPPRRPEVVLPPATLEAYAGDYSLMGTLAHLERHGNRLTYRFLGYRLELVPVSATDFRAEYSILGLFSVPIPFPPVEFARVGQRTLLLMRDRGVAVTGEKIPPYTVPEAWRRRAGSYRLVNPDQEYLVDVEHTRLVVQDGKMLMDVRISGLEDRDVKVVLVPLNDQAAYVFGLGRNVGDITTAETRDGKDYTRYSGYLFERVAD